jgi:hypothetical protein
MKARAYLFLSALTILNGLMLAFQLWKWGYY